MSSNALTRSRPRRLVALAVVMASVAAVGGVATAVVQTLNQPATVTRTAVREPKVRGDVVVVFDVQEVDQFVVAASFRVAEQAGAAAATARTGSAGLQRLARAGATVHAAPDGYLIPMVFIGLPPAAVAGVIGSDVSSIVDANSVVMNEATAAIMRAQVGDSVELRAEDGSTQAFTVAGIRPSSQVGGSELVMTTEAATRLGVVEDTQAVIWGIESRSAIETALQSSGLIGRTDTRVSRSWDPPDPDDTLSTVRVKQLLGEPWYRVVSDDSIAMHPTWEANNLTAGRVLLNATIPVRARCHNAVVAGLSAALAEVNASGLASQIDVGNTNTYGGCFNARYNRLSGFLSRHAYGIAIDMNTVTNCQGCVPRMSCEVVRIFRKHGFAWGGNFRRPDGMHFEWVGEPRHLVSYPSTYCPNTGAALRAADPVELGNEVLTIGVERVGSDAGH